MPKVVPRAAVGYARQLISTLCKYFSHIVTLSVTILILTQVLRSIVLVVRIAN